MSATIKIFEGQRTVYPGQCTGFNKIIWVSARRANQGTFAIPAPRPFPRTCLEAAVLEQDFSMISRRDSK